MIPIKEVGEFKAFIRAYASRESQKKGSQSLAMSLDCVMTHRLVDNEWVEIKDAAYFAEGDIYFIRADGTEDVTRVEQLMQATGWDGTTTALDGVDPDTFQPLAEDKRWKPKDVIVRIVEDDYLVQNNKGGLRYKVDSVRPIGDVPRVVTQAGAQRRAQKAALARARAIGTAPSPPASVSQAEPGSGEIPF